MPVHLTNEPRRPTQGTPGYLVSIHEALAKPERDQIIIWLACAICLNHDTAVQSGEEGPTNPSAATFGGDTKEVTAVSG